VREYERFSTAAINGKHRADHGALSDCIGKPSCEVTRSGDLFLMISSGGIVTEGALHGFRYKRCSGPAGGRRAALHFESFWG
jgi:N-methylhydantoinase A/oxoprolinase/acetone carboxylase beta subunit